MRRPVPALLAGALLALPAAAAGVDLGKLPAWAQAAARASLLETPPAEAEAWVLLDHWEVAYAGAGKVALRRLRLVRVLGGRGLEEAYLGIDGLQDGGAKVREIRGWNLRPDGELVKLGSADKATFGGLGGTQFDRRQMAVALLPRVAEGSLVAFESEVDYPRTSGALTLPILDTHPIRRWELEAGTRSGLFADIKDVKATVRFAHLAPWLPATLTPGTHLALDRLPAMPKPEGACPFPGRDLPSVSVRFQDPAWAGTRMLDAWEAFGGWYHGVFAPRTGPVGPEAPAAGAGLEGLKALWRWFGEALVYKQIYLTADRGDVPEAAAEVARKRYGDCKDLACLFVSMAARSGFQGFPVLARIQGGPVRADEVQGPVQDLFDHVIVALRLDKPLGLPAEVETPKGRFLLLDPTAPLTAFGQLPAGHRGGQLLICLPGDGVWAAVPASAAPEGGTTIRMKGTLGADGRLTADVRLEETANAWGLRATARSATAEAFRAYLEAECLDQALNGRIEVVAKGDPLDLARPFTVDLRIVSPKALIRLGGDFVFLPCLGLPGTPAPFTAPGRKRQLPVHVRGGGRVRLEASLALPMALRPLDPQRSAETPFRSLSWRVSTRDEGGAPRLEVQVEHQGRDADFPVTALAEAAEAWKRDRALVRALREDGLALRP